VELAGNGPLTPYHGVMFLAAIVSFWVLVCLLLARVGGWTALARCYAGEVRVPRARWRLRSGSMRYLTNYNNVLTITVGEDALGLSVFAMFRPGHAPLRIPWDDIEAVPGRMMFMDVVRLGFRRVPGVTLRIPATLAQRIAEARGQPLPAPGGSP